MIRSSTFLDVDSSRLSASEKEHITQHFYRHAERFSIVNVESSRDGWTEDVAVDNPEDLRRLEELVERNGVPAPGFLQ